MQLNKNQITQLQTEILHWYTVNQRDLPWRKTHDPYKIFVSEIMLQQTQVNRVIPKYESWLEKFPNVASLAKANKEDILRLWSGLGYNRRALYLQKTAQAILERGSWPETIEDLQKLPGIGPYTSRAIACFAFGQQVAVVDANVRKVILTKFGDKKKEINTKELQQIAEQLLPIGHAYDWNQALMDYSNLVLQQDPTSSRQAGLRGVSKVPFKDSNRYYRGKVLRLLLEQKTIPIEKLGYLLKDDYSEKDREWADALLKKLENDDLIHIRDGKAEL